MEINICFLRIVLEESLKWFSELFSKKQKKKQKAKEFFS
jgi:hypothetical protein